MPITRRLSLAAQTIVSEEYANGNGSLNASTNVTSSGSSVAYDAAIKSLGEVSGNITAVTVTDGKVVSLTYSGSKVCTYTHTSDSAGSYSVATSSSK